VWGPPERWRERGGPRRRPPRKALAVKKGLRWARASPRLPKARALPLASLPPARFADEESLSTNGFLARVPPRRPPRKVGNADPDRATPYTLHPAPYTPHPTSYTLHPAPHTLHPAPYTLHPAPLNTRVWHAAIRTGESSEIDNLLPNNQRQRRTCYALCHLLYPVSAAHTSIFRMDSNSTSYSRRVNALEDSQATHTLTGLPRRGAPTPYASLRRQ
jgi:hypothetical protein